MQVSRGRRNVGVAHEALDDIDVLALANEARRIAVTPPVGKVPTTYTGRSQGGSLKWVLGSVPRRERHLRSKDLPARPVFTLNSGSSVRAYRRGPDRHATTVPARAKEPEAGRVDSIGALR
jgi:hypothetical protein